MSRIRDRMQTEKRLAFSQFFNPNMHKSTLVGVFLAVLELVRHYQLSVDQNTLFGEIWLAARADASEPLDLSNVDNYDHTRTPESTTP